jgi:hypothetical protein
VNRPLAIRSTVTLRCAESVAIPPPCQTPPAHTGCVRHPHVTVHRSKMVLMELTGHIKSPHSVWLAAHAGAARYVAEQAGP